MLRWIACLGAVAGCGRVGFDAVSATDCALASPWDRGATYARVLHVSPTGDDANDGSAGQPLATLTAAAALATPGTRILLAAGTYPSARVTVTGTQAQPIAITGEAGAIIDGMDASSNGLTCADCSWVVIENLTLRNVMNAISLDNSSSGGTTGSIVRDITVESAILDGIKLYWGDRFYFERNTIVHGSHDGIFVIGGRTGMITGNSIQAADKFGIEVTGGSTDVTVHGNRVQNAGEVAFLVGSNDITPRPPEIYQARGTLLASNIVLGGPGRHVEIDDAASTQIVHNTFINPNDPSMMFIVHEATGPAGGATGATVADNLIVFSTAALSSFVAVVGTSALDTFTFQHNLWWATDDPSFAGPTMPAPLVETTPILGIDPGVTADGHLAPGSPARALGNSAPDVPDFDGTCFGTPSTPGADEP